MESKCFYLKKKCDLYVSVDSLSPPNIMRKSLCCGVSRGQEAMDWVSCSSKPAEFLLVCNYRIVIAFHACLLS